MTKPQYRVLVLTDHRKHSVENSLYALMQQMREHPRCAGVDIASRGNAKNDPFFYGLNSDALHAIKVDEDFQFEPSGQGCWENYRLVKPSDYDAIFLRLPRPVEDEFLHWLGECFGAMPMINHPHGILQTSNKAFLLQLQEVCPPVKLCHSVAEVKAFAANFPIVLKPLREYGGRGLLKIDGNVLDDGNENHDTNAYLSKIEHTFLKDGMLAMQYLKNVSQGDKRIIVVGGQIMVASLRLPAPGSWLCNVAQGGTSVFSEPDAEEKAIINQINPKLESVGILIYGADTLVNDDGKRVLSEVNTLSIGGFPQAQEQTGIPVISITIDKFFQHVDLHYK